MITTPRHAKECFSGFRLTVIQKPIIFIINCRRRYMAEILLIRLKTPNNQTIYRNNVVLHASCKRLKRLK